MDKWTGLLHLTAEDRNGKTVPKHVYFEGAFKVMRPIYHDNTGQACYYLLNPGGGYLDGDRYQMHIAVENHAKLTITTQSATKVYKTPNDHVYQESEFRLKEGSYLEYLPDPLIAYQDAKYKQKNVIRMDKSSTLIYSDIITPGWSPDGDLFSYDTIQLLNEIYVEDELVVFDHIKLKPAKQDVREIGFMEGYTHLGSLIVVSEHTSDDLINRLYNSVSTEVQDCKLGISRLPVKGFTVRILAHTTQKIERIISECHQMISMEWFQTSPSFLRKY